MASRLPRRGAVGQIVSPAEDAVKYTRTAPSRIILRPRRKPP